jgi:ATP-dependent DNA ligase
MSLPVNPPLKPMLAKLSRELPVGDQYVYEPKWDGFRCIVFRDGEEVELGSRNEKPLTRYFPELLPALRANLPDRCVVDGEIVIPGPNGLDFDSLLNRIHPAVKRITLLAAETPASFVAFDLLALGDDDLRDTPFAERRRLLVEALAGAQPPVHLTPATDDPDRARDWFDRFEGAGLDGVIAKDPSLPYCSDQRVLWKVKHHRTADCVVAGYRWHKDNEGVGSLLLGLYDDDGTLHHVGVCSSFSAKFRKELVDELQPLLDGALDDHPWGEWASAQAQAEGGRMPGAVSRWNAGKDLSWVPLRAERAIEVEYDQLQSGRFRRVARFIRWRPDKDPKDCCYDQLEAVVPYEFLQVFTPGGSPPG